MGFLGLFVGPVLMALLVAIWREWMREVSVEEVGPEGLAPETIEVTVAAEPVEPAGIAAPAPAARLAGKRESA